MVAWAVLAVLIALVTASLLGPFVARRDLPGARREICLVRLFLVVIGRR